ncbi:MAG: SH3 domain-containing protein, partial [Clostridia bacterium]|nr:SH3 domain-containing protein [Clostridia bacterium]
MKKILSAVLVAVMLLLAASAAFGENLDDILDHMYVNCANGKMLNLRDAPGGKVIAQLDNGTKVWISGGFISKDWVAVTVKLKGKYVEGFVKNEFLQSKKPGKYEITEREDNFDDVKPYVVTAKALNAKTDNSVGLRVKPNKTAKSIRRLTAGDQLTVLASGRVWLKVLDQETGKIGYVADDYMIFDHYVEDEVPEDEPEDEVVEVAEAVEEVAFGAMTYADFATAELDSEVTVETYIQACAYAPAYGNASAFCQDEFGAVYLYRLPCDDELAARLVPGTKVKVTGFKSEWSGEVEIIDISAIEVLDAEAY